ncbi:methylated-DNA--[protein]-cysteine S-methyltransferase [Halalkalibacter hemicellulosilyticus]|uniref:Methylated-DNA--protein-cysteine methyltransferase n=1 Tax=Halalkalibacter hemicellulosilyticusJCM 9152 TaxID=1236971 RepID=W4QD77_9BACI|nr:methylated-DNA--[protein]-cysteine S-methyltransferase [Halalkalibacter hemicellulosilyticus]GAE29990.1 methylated-DNA-protein-cysteine methyltransferase [Halalkalibacter hemicellulosilyticusJCM 9152]
MSSLFTHYVDELDSPLGPLTIVATEKGLCHLYFGEMSTCQASLKAWLKKQSRCGDIVHCSETLRPYCAQLEEYFAGERDHFDVPLDLCGTPFQKKVWSALTQIRYGETVSYKEIAERIGAPRAVRAIGGANNQNPIPIVIPCHRVIGSNGNMVGYGGGLDKKERLLSLEGAIQKISS